jgi:hypothetical protein
MPFDGDEIATMAGASAWLAYAGHGQTITRYDQFFQLVDKAHGAPVSGFSYGLKTQASEHHDKVYSDGATAKAYAQDPQSIALTYLVQTEMGVRP